MSKHHRHEKRHGYLKDTRSLSCAIYRCTLPDNRKIKPMLAYDMEFSFCIVCNAPHWILGERQEFEFVDREAQQISDPAMRRAYLYLKGKYTKSR